MALCDDLEAKQTQKHSHLVKLGTGSLNALQQSTTEEELIRWWGHLQNNFGLIFDCVENVEALRQTILELAVRGMLGTSDDKDAPALKMIDESSGNTIQILYSVPSNWIWIKLASAIQSMTNGIYRPATCYSDDGIACLRMYNINRGKINFKDLKRMSLTNKEANQYSLLEGDFLVNRVNKQRISWKSGGYSKYCRTFGI